MSALATVGGALRAAPRATVRGVRAGAVGAVRLPGDASEAIARNPRRSAIVLGAVAIVLAAAVVAFAMLTIRQAAVEQARTDAVGAAEQKVPALLSYDYRTVENDQQAKVDLLTGAFHDDYASLLKDVVVPAAKSSKLTTSSTVVTTSVVSTEGTDKVTLLMFLNQTSSSAQQQDPTISGSRLRVSLEDVDGDWKVSEMTPV